MTAITAKPNIAIPLSLTKGEHVLGIVVPLTGAREPKASLQLLFDLVNDDMGAVNRIIIDKARSDVDLIPELARHLIDSGGKRLRPM